MLATCPRVHVYTVYTCPPPHCLRRAGRHVRALQQRARVLQAVPSQVRAELPRPGHQHLHLVHHHNLTAGGEPAVREVRLLPRGAQLLLHPLLPGVHGPGQGQQVSQTGGMVTPYHRTSQPHDSLVSSVRSSRVTARAAARSAPPPAWRPPPGASVCPSASSTQATPSAAGS